MPYFNARHQYPVYATVQELTASEKLAFWWPLRKQLGAVLGFVYPLASIASVVAIALSGLLPMVAEEVRFAPEVFFTSLVVGSVLMGLFVTHNIAHWQLRLMRNDHRFRFEKMQDPTPSFKVLNLYRKARPVTSDGDMEQINKWLVLQWPNDRYCIEYRPYATAWGPDEQRLEVLTYRVDTFLGLPIQIPEAFVEACKALLDRQREELRLSYHQGKQDARKEIAVQTKILNHLERMLKYRLRS